MRASGSEPLEEWTVTGHPRLWHNPCVKHIDLPKDDWDLIRHLEETHTCGPLTTPWDSAR